MHLFVQACATTLINVELNKLVEDKATLGDPPGYSTHERKLCVCDPALEQTYL